MNKRVFNSRYHCYFFINGKKLSSHMAHVNKHINSSNHKIHSCEQIRKIVVNLVSRGFENKKQLPMETQMSTEFVINEYCRQP